MPFSIRWRLVLSYVALTVLTVSLVGVLSISLVQEYIRAETKAQLTENARAVASQAGGLMQPMPRIPELSDLAQSVSFLGRVRVRILDAHAEVMIDSGPPGAFTSVVWIQPDPKQNGRPSFMIPIAPGIRDRERQEKWFQENFTRLPSVIVRVDEGPWGREMIFQAIIEEDFLSQTLDTLQIPGAEPFLEISGESVRIPIGDGSSPLGFVQLDRPNSAGIEILSAMRRSLVLAGIGASMVAILAGLLVSRSLTAPILALSNSAARMSSGDLTARAPVSGAKEIGQLASQFNQMAERLQASFAALSTERDALRRFIADASHELRTPITALSNFIELLQGPAASDKVAQKEFLAESAEQVRRMEWITTNLLDLSRLDAGLIPLDRQPVDLGELLVSAAAPLQQRAQEREIRLVVRMPDPPLTASVDRTWMEIALGNLLDNAFKFSPPASQILVEAEASDMHTKIHVTDQGSGIEPEDLPHIFERFYRAKTSQAGSGLGLAIVQSIIKAHGGTVAVESQPGLGSRFTINV